MSRPTRAHIDLGAATANAAFLRRLSGASLYAVVKADAYGHGAVELSRAFLASGTADALAVSLVEEGLELREAGVGGEILVMGPALAGGYRELAEHDMTVLVSDLRDIEPLSAAGAALGRPVSVHLKVDTGMGRLGAAMSEVEAALASIVSAPGLRLTGLATHFACADEDDPDAPDSMTARQLRRFDEAVTRAGAAGVRGVVTHTANSAALLRFPSSRRDAVRPGLALYGAIRHPELRPVMRLATEIAQLRQVNAGQSVSYGALWTATRDSRLAVLPIGYADGLPRAATGRASALINGSRVPLVGAICMDMVVADVTELGDAAAVGDEVVLLGAQGGDCIDATEFAENANLIEYEVTCGISKRVPRLYE